MLATTVVTTPDTGQDGDPALMPSPQPSSCENSSSSSVAAATASKLRHRSSLQHIAPSSSSTLSSGSPVLKASTPTIIMRQQSPASQASAPLISPSSSSFSSSVLKPLAVPNGSPSLIRPHLRPCLRSSISTSSLRVQSGRMRDISALLTSHSSEKPLSAIQPQPPSPPSRESKTPISATAAPMIDDTPPLSGAAGTVGPPPGLGPFPASGHFPAERTLRHQSSLSALAAVHRLQQANRQRSLSFNNNSSTSSNVVTPTTIATSGAANPDSKCNSPGSLCAGVDSAMGSSEHEKKHSGICEHNGMYSPYASLSEFDYSDALASSSHHVHHPASAGALCYGCSSHTNDYFGRGACDGLDGHMLPTAPLSTSSLSNTYHQQYQQRQALLPSSPSKTGFDLSLSQPRVHPSATAGSLSAAAAAAAVITRRAHSRSVSTYGHPSLISSTLGNPSGIPTIGSIGSSSMIAGSLSLASLDQHQYHHHPHHHHHHHHQIRSASNSLLNPHSLHHAPHLMHKRSVSGSLIDSAGFGLRHISSKLSLASSLNSNLSSLNNSATNLPSFASSTAALGMYDIDTATGDPITPSRSLWVGGLDRTVTSADIIPVFRQFGIIESVRLLPDKECAFVNFALLEDAIRARAELSSTSNSVSNKIGNCTIRVAFGKGEAHMGNDAQAMQPTKSVWIGNISSGTTSAMLESVFGEFGAIESIRVLNLKSCAFVNFEKLEDAVRAKNAIAGKEIDGSVVRVGYAKVVANSQQQQQQQLTSQQHQSHFMVPNNTAVGSHSSTADNSTPSSSVMAAANLPYGAATHSLLHTQLSDLLSNKARDKMASSSSGVGGINGIFSTRERGKSVSSNDSTTVMPGVIPVAAAVAVAAAAVSTCSDSGGNNSVDANDVLEPGAGLIIDERLIAFPYATSLPSHPTANFDQDELKDIRRRLEPPSRSRSSSINQQNNRNRRNSRSSHNKHRSSFDDNDDSSADSAQIAYYNNVYSQFIDSVVELSTDFIGNIVVQKLFEHGTPTQQMEIMTRLAPHFAAIGAHKNGTWCAQKIIECASATVSGSISHHHHHQQQQQQLQHNQHKQQLQQIIADSLSKYTPLLLQDQFGNYVVQGCLKFTSNLNQFVFDAIHARCNDIAQTRYGSRAIRTCLESPLATRAQQKLVAVAIVASDPVSLIMSQNGALVMNWLLDVSGFVGRFRALAPQLVSRLGVLCTNKTAMSIVLKFFQQNSNMEHDAWAMLLGAIFFCSLPESLDSLIVAVDGKQNDIVQLALVAGATAGTESNPNILQQLLVDNQDHGVQFVTQVWEQLGEMNEFSKIRELVAERILEIDTQFGIKSGLESTKPEYSSAIRKLHNDISQTIN